MNEISQLFDSNLDALVMNAPMFLPSQVFDFIMAIIMSYALRLIFERNTKTLSGFTQIASILPPLTGAIFLVIVIVKSSLALSLGLVGALSIVRFRTPIKEPQELLYLFLAIGIGLGYGASLTLHTTVIVVLLFAYLIFFEGREIASKVTGHQVTLDTPGKASSVLDSIEEFLLNNSIKHKILRVEKSNLQDVRVVFSVDVPGVLDKSGLKGRESVLFFLENEFPKGRVSMMEDRINW